MLESEFNNNAIIYRSEYYAYENQHKVYYGIIADNPLEIGDKIKCEILENLWSSGSNRFAFFRVIDVNDLTQTIYGLWFISLKMTQHYPSIKPYY